MSPPKLAVMEAKIGLAGNQFSSDSLGLAQANGVAIVPIGRAFELAMKCRCYRSAS